MSTISSVGAGSSAWANPAASPRMQGGGGSFGSEMKAKMFAKVDADGSGGVDTAELQGLLNHVAKKTGAAAGDVANDAKQMFGKMDADGDGSLSSDELDAGMKSLLPAPSSTVEFAQRQGGPGGEGGPPPGGPPPGGPPPGGQADGASAASSSSSTSSSASTDPLDTNQDGTVSAQERIAGQLADMVKMLSSALDEAAGKTGISSSTSSSNSSNSTAASSTDGNTSAASAAKSGKFDIQALTDLVRDVYSRAAANQQQPISTVSETV